MQKRRRRRRIEKTGWQRRGRRNMRLGKEEEDAEEVDEDNDGRNVYAFSNSIVYRTPARGSENRNRCSHVDSCAALSPRARCTSFHLRQPTMQMIADLTAKHLKLNSSCTAYGSNAS
jgi:hypothetical protein